MMKGDLMAQHLNQLNPITTQLISMEIKFDEKVQASTLLSYILDSWNATVTILNSLVGSNKLKFEDVRGLVLSE